MMTAGGGKEGVAEAVCHRSNHESGATHPTWKHMQQNLLIPDCVQRWLIKPQIRHSWNAIILDWRDC